MGRSCRKKLFSRCYVYSLKKINKKNILIIQSTETDLLELSYSSESLKKKINTFYSTEFIDVIKFKKIITNLTIYGRKKYE